MYISSKQNSQSQHEQAHTHPQTHISTVYSAVNPFLKRKAWNNSRDVGQKTEECMRMTHWDEDEEKAKRIYPHTLSSADKAAPGPNQARLHRAQDPCPPGMRTHLSITPESPNW